MTRTERTSSELRPLRNKVMRLVKRIDEAEPTVTRIEDDIVEIENLAANHKMPRGTRTQLTHAVNDAKRMLGAYIGVSSGLTLFAHALKEAIEKEEAHG